MIPNDPNILLSVINMKLRDFYSSLDKLCDDLDYDKNLIEEKLRKINYYYDKDINQFKEKNYD